MIVTVTQYDTLEGIARRYHTSAATISEENKLGEGEPIPGMRLLIHGYLWHVWRAGDTLSSVAALYGVRPVAVEAPSDGPAYGIPVKIHV